MRARPAAAGAVIIGLVALAAWLAAMTVAAAADPAAAAPPAAAACLPRSEAYLDPTLGAESGARDVATLVSALGCGEAWLSRRADSAALRTVRTLVWDLPVGWWFGVAQHEVFGHGGRAREFHASPGFHLGSPWGGRDSYASFDAEGLSTEQRLFIYAGGVEANDVAATFLARRAVEGVRLRPLDLIVLAANRFTLSDYILRTTPDPADDPGGFYAEYAGGGDAANYLGLLNTLASGTTGISPSAVDPAVDTQYRRLRRQAWWNLADPGAWWALASVTRQVARGDDAPPLPLPRAGGWRFLPLLSAEWTPSGGQASLEWVMAPAAPRERVPSWWSVVVRRGEGPAGPFGAAGAAVAEALPAGPLLLGGTVEAWRDPEHGLGGGARLRGRVARGSARGLTFDLGVKSQGYWVGQPAGAGPYVAVGYVAAP